MYKTYVSPDGEHEQQVSSRVREVELRHAGWKPKAAKPDQRTATAKSETAKETK